MPEREVLEADVLIVGGGAAGLSCAIHLYDQFVRHNPGRDKPSVYLLEKGPNLGAHILSGAVFDTRGLDELIPEWRQQNAPITQPVVEEEILLLTKKRKIPIPGPAVPPYLHNKGNYIISAGELAIWLGEQARKRGIEILEGVAGAELLMDGRKVTGVRCNDTGVGKDGKPRATYQAGADIRAKVTVLAEGPRGSLTKQLVNALSLDAGRNPQTYALGVKEVWELPAGTFPAGKIVHTLGFPLQKGPLDGWYVQEKDFGLMRGPIGLGLTSSDSFGGSFLYGQSETLLSIGLVVGLDYNDPYLDPHYEFNRFKTHPWIKGMLEKGKLLSYGAKTIPEGGYYSMPRMYGDGFLIVGDSASFVNAARLKGLHLAIKSGMLAADTILAALAKQDFSDRQLGQYEDLFQNSWAKEELYGMRNWRQGYAKGLAKGAVHDLAQRWTKGKGVRDPLTVQADHEEMQRMAVHHPDMQGLGRYMPDGKLTLDKVTDVFSSGTKHGEDQPCHLKVPDLNLCVQRCTVEFGNPCQHFCPAGVYEWIQPQKFSQWGQPEKGHLNINAGNCVHCKTCDIKDPYENILWVTPEGGDGPRYNKM